MGFCKAICTAISYSNKLWLNKADVIVFWRIYYISTSRGKINLKVDPMFCLLLSMMSPPKLLAIFLER